MEDVLAIRDEYRLQEWRQIIQAGQNSGLSKREFRGFGRTQKAAGEINSPAAFSLVQFLKYGLVYTYAP